MRKFLAALALISVVFAMLFFFVDNGKLCIFDGRVPADSSYIGDVHADSSDPFVIYVPTAVNTDTVIALVGMKGQYLARICNFRMELLEIRDITRKGNELVLYTRMVKTVKTSPLARQKDQYEALRRAVPNRTTTSSLGIPEPWDGDEPRNFFDLQKMLEANGEFGICIIDKDEASNWLVQSQKLDGYIQLLSDWPAYVHVKGVLVYRFLALPGEGYTRFGPKLIPAGAGDVQIIDPQYRYQTPCRSAAAGGFPVLSPLRNPNPACRQVSLVCLLMLELTCKLKLGLQNIFCIKKGQSR